MTARNRIKDMLPVLIVFFVVASFGTIVFVQYVARETIVVPAPQKTPADELPKPFIPRH